MDTMSATTYEINTSPVIKAYDAANTPTNDPDSFIISELTGELMVNTDLDYTVYEKWAD